MWWFFKVTNCAVHRGIKSAGILVITTEAGHSEERNGHENNLRRSSS